MRRSLAGLLLIASFGLLALSVSTWWLQQVAFSPAADTDATYAIMRDDDIRREVATIIAQVNAPELSVTTEALRDYIEESTELYDGALLMNRFVRDAHARLIGERSEPVAVNAAEQVQIVRSELVALEEEIPLPAAEVGVYAFINTLLSWITLLSLGFGVVLLIAGLLTRPERGELSYAIAIGFGALAVLLVLLGYLVPLGVLPALSDATWAGVFARLATNSRNLTLMLAAASAVVAVATMLGTSSLRQRRQRSTPLSMGRYREQHSWSR